MEDLNGKRALVTGGSQGIGRCISLALGAAGCHVLVNCAHNRANAERVAEEIRSAGGSAEILPCDVSDETAVLELFRHSGPLDILVNNARLDPWLRNETMTEGQWFDLVTGVNLKGAFLLSQGFLKQAKPRRFGRIVNVSSVRAFRPAEPHMVAYGVSKAGMHVLTRSFAEQGAPYNITANTVAPGMVVTENIGKRLSPEKYEEERRAVPLGRGATGEEIADAVLFVIRNGYVTGETLNINGGMYYAP